MVQPQTPPEQFIHYRRVAYCDTDAMGVVHHSNHVKYFEEARVEWLRHRNLMHIHAPLGELTFAVVDLDIRFRRPARFDDRLEIWVQARLVRARIFFQYAIWNQRTEEWIATGRTTLVPLDADFQPRRIPEAAQVLFSQEPWQEEWPPLQRS